VSLFAPANTWKTNINGLGLFTDQIGYAWNESKHPAKTARGSFSAQAA
jgi:hypothetical protein